MSTSDSTSVETKDIRITQIRSLNHHLVSRNERSLGNFHTWVTCGLGGEEKRLRSDFFRALEGYNITNHIAPQRSDHLDLLNYASGAALKFNSMQHHWAARRDIRCGHKKHPATDASGSGHTISALLSSGHGHRIMLPERLLMKD